MGDYDLVVGEEGDWGAFGQRGLDSIVDPMVFRSAEVFLLGSTEAARVLGQDEETLWGGLTSNVGAIVAFFDAIVLSERLPIIDYGITFDNLLDYGAMPIRDRVNDAAGEQLIDAVHVMHPASDSARAAALAALGDAPLFPRGLQDEVLGELSALDHRWRPDLGDIVAASPEQLRLLQFAYGGLLFSQYAASAGAVHVLQPKRARLYLQLGNAAPGANEDELFSKLRESVADDGDGGAQIVGIDGLPPVLPYLLTDAPQTPAQLLESALKLRRSGAASDYRAWRHTLLREWREQGRISNDVKRDVKGAATALKDALAPRDVPQFELNLTLAGLVPGLVLPVRKLLRWVVGRVPGRRHTTLLMQLAAAHGEYVKLDRALGTVWRQ